MKICWDTLNTLRYNKKTGKWYKDRYKDGKKTGTNSYLLNEEGCKICGDWFLYAPHNEGKFCSLSCTTKYRNSIIKISESTKIKISKTKTGVKMPEEQRLLIKYRPQNQRWKGENNPSWKGGITSENHLIYGSAKYKEWRKYVLNRDDYTCNMCGKRGGKLQVHHIKRFSIYRDLITEKTNGITLCIECHRSIRGKEEEYEEFFQNIIEENRKVIIL